MIYSENKTNKINYTRHVLNFDTYYSTEMSHLNVWACEREIVNSSELDELDKKTHTKQI